MKITKRSRKEPTNNIIYSTAYYARGMNDIRHLEDMLSDEDFTFEDMRDLMDRMSLCQRQRMEKSYAHIIHKPAHAIKGFISKSRRRILIGQKRL